MIKKIVINKTIITLALLLASILTQAASEINTRGSKDGTAIEGYDTVAYFTESKAVKGNRDFKHRWKDANWYFSSQENLELFKDDPEKYAPQYGGYCAYAVAKNDLAKIDPNQFTVLNDKLYLNYNKRINRKWNRKRDEYIADANDNWPSVLNRGKDKKSKY